MIEARQLTKAFKDRKRGQILAADQVSFRCEPGQISGLLGSNGAGKTTILRLLATILKPSSGTALVAGFDLIQEPEKVRTKIGFLSTATALYGRLSAREMVEYFGRLHGLEEAAMQRRIDELFSRLGMMDFQNGRCDKLSTGMKQKVSIARALVHDPPVIILDEPTLGLDVLAARTIVSFIKECRTAGKTVIFSTHVMSEVEKLCDHVAIIHQGKILESGTLSGLREKHQTQEVEEIFVRTVQEVA